LAPDGVRLLRAWNAMTVSIRCNGMRERAIDSIGGAASDDGRLGSGA
jgi:hypothetical protein